MITYEKKLVDSSRSLADILVADIGNDHEKFSAMMTIAMEDEYPISMRAARVIELCTENNHLLVIDHLPFIIGKIGKFKVEGVRRAFLKILAERMADIEEDSVGKLTDLAFGWLCNRKEAIAVRYYCIEILVKVVTEYPDISTELIACLNNLLEEDSAGLRSKSRHVIKQLEKLNSPTR
jgi:hypothetical protein